MEYFEAHLFLGFPIDDDFDQHLKKVDTQLLEHYVGNGDDYLKEVFFHNTRYLGKFAGRGSHLADLDLLEENIYSLLKKIVPQYPYEETSLVLFPATEELKR